MFVLAHLNFTIQTLNYPPPSLHTPQLDLMEDKLSKKDGANRHMWDRVPVPAEPPWGPWRCPPQAGTRWRLPATPSPSVSPMRPHLTARLAPGARGVGRVGRKQRWIREWEWGHVRHPEGGDGDPLTPLGDGSITRVTYESRKKSLRHLWWRRSPCPRLAPRPFLGKKLPDDPRIQHRFQLRRNRRRGIHQHTIRILRSSTGTKHGLLRQSVGNHVYSETEVEKN